ncbi:MAG: ATP-binding protein [Polyangiaceae bacterium]
MSAAMPAAAPRSDDLRAPANAIVQRWLAGLRWVAFALLALTLPVGEALFGFHVRYEIALPAVALAAAVNVLASRVLSRRGTARAPGPRAIAAFVAFDLVTIGVVLAASGGAANPFSALFLVHVALAAAVLPATLTFALSALAVGVFASLFAVPAGTCCAAHASDGSFSNHLYGMWMAFVLCAGLVAFFITRIRHALEARDREVLRLRREAEHAARFASLGTLAAGTAHELGTPLGTIAVLAGELTAGDLPEDESRAHARAITAAVHRCRDVVSKMQSAAHTTRAAAAPLDLALAVREAVADWRAAHPDLPVTFRADPPQKSAPLFVALAAEDLVSTLGVLLDNAAFAQQKASRATPLTLTLAAADARATLTLDDDGPGIPADLLEKLGEPFLTTKEPGEGMGLGLYLARGLIEPLGGRLTLENKPPRGARATLELPLVTAPAFDPAADLAQAAE